MKLFYGRPLCFGCAGAAAAAFFCAYAGSTASFITAGAALVFAVLSIMFLKPRGGVNVRLYAVLFFALVCAVCLSCGVYYADKDSYVTEDQVFLTGYVDPSFSSGDCYKVKITNLGGKPVNVDMYADFGYYTPYDYAKFSAYGAVSKTAGEDSLYLMGRGVFFKTELTRVSFNGTQRGFLYRVNILRKYIASRFYEVGGEGGLYCCLFLGRRSSAPEALSSDFRSLGVTHLLAVSGLHVAALLAGADFVLTRLFGKRKFIFILLALAALFYAALAGFSGSVVRAAIMYFIMSAGRVFDMKSDGITGLSLAVVLILFACPYAVYDIGFLLSASATAGIILVGAPCARAIEKASVGKGGAARAFAVIGESFAVTLSALVFTVPAAAAGYGQVVFISLLANIALAPFIMILLYACPYMIVLSYIPAVGRLAGAFCDGIAEIAGRIAHALTYLPPLSVSVKYGFMKYLIAAFAAAAVILIAAGVKKRVFYLGFCALFAVSFIGSALIYNASFDAKDVMIIQSSSKGEIIALCSGGKCTVFDMSDGASAYGLSGELLKHGVTEADYVCAADFTSYHIQSVPAVCRVMRINSLTLPCSTGSPLCAELCGREAEYYDAETDAVFECGRLSAGVTRKELQNRIYATLDVGGAAYSEGLPVYGKDTVVYGQRVIDAPAASFSADTVYLPEKYNENDEINTDTEFYGEIAVIVLK